MVFHMKISSFCRYQEFFCFGILFFFAYFVGKLKSREIETNNQVGQIKKFALKSIYICFKTKQTQIRRFLGHVNVCSLLHAYAYARLVITDIIQIPNSIEMKFLHEFFYLVET